MNVLSCARREKLFSPGDRVGVAVSGGSDSMALLCELFRLREELQIELICVNFEHGLRGEASIADTEFVRRKAAELGLEFIGGSGDTAQAAKRLSMTIEQAGRHLRYEFFKRLTDGGRCDKVAVAHNAEDNAESVLMHIFRGAGTSGACGMKYISGKIVRPLLDTPKRDILEYISNGGIEYVTDETNADTHYTRNFIRCEVLPLIERRYPGACGRIVSFASSLAADEEYLSLAAEGFLCGEGEAVFINERAFCEKSLYPRAIKAAAARLGQTADIERVHIEDIAALARSKNGGRVSLPGGITAVKEYDKICLHRERSGGCESIPFSLGEMNVGGVFVSARRAAPQFGRGGLFISDDPRLGGCEVRFPREGDIFRPFGGGSKKLCKYLSDKKIPERERKRLPVIADGNEILAIFGVEISENVKVTDGGAIELKIHRRDE